MVNPTRKQCTAKARSTGKQCGRYAIKGADVCDIHGGNAPQVRKAATRRQMELTAQARAERILRRRLGMRLEEGSPDPAQILLNLVATKATEVEWLDAKIQALETDDELFWGKTKRKTGVGANGPVDEETEEAAQHIMYQLLHKAQDQLAKYTSDALRAGIEERQVKLAERTSAQFSWILTQLITRLDLTPSQREQADGLIPTLIHEAPSQGAA